MISCMIPAHLRHVLVEIHQHKGGTVLWAIVTQARARTHTHTHTKSYTQTQTQKRTNAHGHTTTQRHGDTHLPLVARVPTVSGQQEADSLFTQEDRCDCAATRGKAEGPPEKMEGCRKPSDPERICHEQVLIWDLYIYISIYIYIYQYIYIYTCVAAYF